MIINIRGTHGSGKSTILRNLINYYDSVPDNRGERKPHGYKLESPYGIIWVVGSYERECGGCDTIQPYSLIWPRVVEYSETGHVLFEGALVSNSYGNIGRDSECYGSEFVFAFLDTPLDVCIQRILKRRTERGNTKPFDPNKSVVRIYNSNQRVMEKALDLGRRVVVLNHKKPGAQLKRLLNDKDSV